MTTLADIMLDVAEILGGVRTGVATGGTTSTLVDTNRTENADYWKGGTLFLLSGTSSGLATRVLAYGENTLTFTAVAQAITAGILYAVAPPNYTYDVLQIAIQRALDEIGCSVTYDETVTIAASTHTYALPAGVSGLLRVEVATSSASPYSYQINNFWRENNGYLYFDPTKAPSTTGMKIRMWYRVPHVDATLYSTVISNNLNLEYLKWLAAVNVYRDTLSKTGKDDPILIEFFNQAMVKERELRDTRRNFNNYLRSIDPKYGSY